MFRYIIIIIIYEVPTPGRAEKMVPTRSPLLCRQQKVVPKKRVVPKKKSC